MLDAFSDSSYSIIGFQRDHKKQDFSSPRSYNWGKVITGFKPVAEVFRQELTEEQAEKIAKLNTGGEEAGLDNAAKISAYIAAIVAGVSTLFF